MPDRICQYYLDCAFFRRHNNELTRRDRISLFREFIEVYCFGELRDACHRFIHREKTGDGLPDDITPTGKKYVPGL